VAQWRTKNKKVVEIGQISGQFLTTFLQQNYLEYLRFF